MKMKKIAIAFLMSLMASTICLADETLKYGDYEYYINDNETITISGWDGNEEAMKIPSEIDGRDVTELKVLYNINENLKSVEIPLSVVKIERNPFTVLESLRQIVVTPSHEKYAVIDNVLFDKTEKTLVCYPRGLLSSFYVIPEGIKEIGVYAFYSNKNLTNIEIPDSVTKIGSWAFANCKKLTSIEIPDSVTSIGTDAFHGCEKLTSIEIPISVMNIEGNPFMDCVWLDQIIVSPDHEKYAVIDNVLFDKMEKTIICYSCGLGNSSYAIPEGIKKIGGCAFADCNNLTSIKLPDSVTTIENNAFTGCENLTSIEIPDSVITIGEFVIAGCNSLTSLEIPDSVTSIGTYAFSNCEKLTLTVGRDSYAKQYAIDNDIPYTYTDANDWLNN